jgi:hypothetical protein
MLPISHGGRMSYSPGELMQALVKPKCLQVIPLDLS